MAASEQHAGRGWMLFLLLSGYLIVTFLYRAFVPGGSWPPSPWHYVFMGLTMILIAGLVGQKAVVSASLAGDDPKRRWITPLFVAGMVSGFGSLLIRLTSEQAWWTGHLN